MRSRRALVIAPLPPEYDREAGSQAVLDMIEFLDEDGWAVSFVAENPRPRGSERYMRMLRQRGIAAYGGFGHRTDELIAEGRFEVAICVFWYTAEAMVPRIRVLSPHTKVAVHTIDLHFLRNARRLFAGGERLDMDYAGDLVRELNVYASCEAVLTVSEKEADLVASLTGRDSLALVVPLFDAPEESHLDFDRRRGLVFLGNFRHPPNVEAVSWLLEDVVPAIPAPVLTEHPIYIVGNELPEELRQLGDRTPGVQMVGWVPSVGPYLQRARASLVPLRHGAGIKLKVIQSLAAGTPIVSTSVGVEGLDLKNGEHALVAIDAEPFAAAIARLVADKKLWNRLSRSGRRVVSGSHNREEARRSFRDAIEALVDRRAAKEAPKHSDRELVDRLLKPRYRDLVERVRRVANEAIPAGGRVAVVSRGDEDLLSLGAAFAEHFPGDESGAWLGWYPESGAQAAALLEKAVSRSVEYLLVPDTASWWLQKYPELAESLERDWSELIRDDGTCVVYRRKDVIPVGPTVT